jgi:hypothetical protein
MFSCLWSPELGDDINGVETSQNPERGDYVNIVESSVR